MAGNVKHTIKSASNPVPQSSSLQNLHVSFYYYDPRSRMAGNVKHTIKSASNPVPQSSSLQNLHVSFYYYDLRSRMAGNVKHTIKSASNPVPQSSPLQNLHVSFYYYDLRSRTTWSTLCLWSPLLSSQSLPPNLLNLPSASLRSCARSGARRVRAKSRTSSGMG